MPVAKPWAWVKPSAAHQRQLLGPLDALGGDRDPLGAGQAMIARISSAVAGLARSWTNALSSLMRWCGSRAR